MTFTADEPVASGQSYPITEVDGRPPGSFDDFAGDISITVSRGNYNVRLVGEAARTAAGVRFHQKDPGPDDRDIRVWTITERGDGAFLAEPFAAF
jgi:hypothetical protein